MKFCRFSKTSKLVIGFKADLNSSLNVCLPRSIKTERSKGVGIGTCHISFYVKN